jgi:hypothetical protein
MKTQPTNKTQLFDIEYAIILHICANSILVVWLTKLQEELRAEIKRREQGK